MTEDHVMGQRDFKHILRRAVGMEDSVRARPLKFAFGRSNATCCAATACMAHSAMRARDVLPPSGKPAGRRGADSSPRARRRQRRQCDGDGRRFLDPPAAEEDEEQRDFFSGLPISPPPATGDLIDDYRIARCSPTGATAG